MPKKIIYDLSTNKITQRDFTEDEQKNRDEELKNKVFWGHSSIEQGIKFFQKAAIKNMLITHHDPSRTDDQLNILSKDLPQGITFAKDGMIVDFT